MGDVCGQGVIYGYARVSARDQNLDRQLDALRSFGVERERIYADKASGRDFNRPAYQSLMKRLQPGDVLVIKSIDRLGRNYGEILDEWGLITKNRRVGVVVLDMPLLDTRHAPEGITGVFIADVVLQLLSYVAQVERDSIRQRQREGIEAARARGVTFGRPPKSRPLSYKSTRDAYLQGIITKREAAKRLSVCTNTFNKWLNEDGVSSDHSNKT